MMKKNKSITVPIEDIKVVITYDNHLKDPDLDLSYLLFDYSQYTYESNSSSRFVSAIYQTIHH